MSLIKVKEIGYSIEGDTLDLTIAIPKGSYLTTFKVYNQDDLQNADCMTIPGFNYISIVAEMEGISEEDAFNEIFEYIKDLEDELTENIWSIYKLKPDFEWAEGTKLHHGINVSQEDLNIIYMKLEGIDTTGFIPSTECGEDTTVETVPLYNLLPMRLKVLNSVQFINDSCDTPRSFMNLLLLIRAIELAICCKDYCKAAKYWNKFWNNSSKKLHKKCGCHE